MHSFAWFCCHSKVTKTPLLMLISLPCSWTCLVFTLQNPHGVAVQKSRQLLLPEGFASFILVQKSARLVHMFSEPAANTRSHTRPLLCRLATIPLASGESKQKGRTPATPWLRMLTQPAVWAIIINNFAFHYAFYVVMNWLPTYFDKVFITHTTGVSASTVQGNSAASVCVDHDCTTSPQFVVKMAEGRLP